MVSLYIRLEPMSVRLTVRPPLIIDVYETSGPIAINFHLQHHFSGGKGALGLRQNRIKTLLSMATNSSHKVISGKTVYL